MTDLTTFKITWSNGSNETDVSADSHTADAYAMQRWGVDSAQRLAEQFNVELEVVEPLPVGETIELDKELSKEEDPASI